MLTNLDTRTTDQATSIVSIKYNPTSFDRKMSDFSFMEQSHLPANVMKRKNSY